MIIDLSEKVGIIVHGKVQEIKMIDIENKLVLSEDIWYRWEEVRFTTILS